MTRPAVGVYEMICGLAADTKLETPEGALTVKSVAGKAVAVFTREAGGRVRFRMLQDVRKVADQQPVLKVSLENGQALRVTGEQVLYKQGMVEVRADALVVGDLLEPAFFFPAGYRFHDDHNGDARDSAYAWRVVKVEAAGSADIYTFSVNKTGNFFFTAGVLGKADGSAA